MIQKFRIFSAKLTIDNFAKNPTIGGIPPILSKQKNWDSSKFIDFLFNKELVWEVLGLMVKKKYIKFIE